MCLMCANNPIDFLDDIEEIKQMYKTIDREKLRKFQAKLIKEKLSSIESDDTQRCDVGTSIVKELRERQYALSREL